MSFPSAIYQTYILKKKKKKFTVTATIMLQIILKMDAGRRSESPSKNGLIFKRHAEAQWGRSQ